MPSAPALPVATGNPGHRRGFRFLGADDDAAADMDGRHQVAAQPVSQLRRLADAPAHEVRTLSYHQAAAILQTQRPGGVDGRAAQRFFRCQAEVGAGQRHGQPQRLQG